MAERRRMIQREHVGGPSRPPKGMEELMGSQIHVAKIHPDDRLRGVETTIFIADDVSDDNPPWFRGNNTEPTTLEFYGDPGEWPGCQHGEESILCISTVRSIKTRGERSLVYCINCHRRWVQ